MKLILRITFTIISALFIAAIIPVGTLWGWDFAVYCVLGACVFFVLMLLCKQAQEREQGILPDYLQNDSQEDMHMDANNEKSE